VRGDVAGASKAIHHSSDPAVDTDWLRQWPSQPIGSHDPYRLFVPNYSRLVTGEETYTVDLVPFVSSSRCVASTFYLNKYVV